MAKKKEEKKNAMTSEEKAIAFRKKLSELLAIAKEKRNVLDYQEISDYFKELQLDAEQFEKILDFLEKNNIDVLRLQESDDDIIINDDEEDLETIELDKIDLVGSRWNQY